MICVCNAFVLHMGMTAIQLSEDNQKCMGILSKAWEKEIGAKSSWQFLELTSKLLKSNGPTNNQYIHLNEVEPTVNCCKM